MSVNVDNIIRDYLMDKGYDGLYNTDGECACMVDDMQPCDSLCADCTAGYLYDCRNCSKSPHNGGDCRKTDGEYSDSWMIGKERDCGFEHV